MYKSSVYAYYGNALNSCSQKKKSQKLHLYNYMPSSVEIPPPNRPTSWRSWCFSIPRKLPFGNDTIPRRTNDHRVDRMPTTISYSTFMIIKPCNLSSGHLYLKGEVYHQFSQHKMKSLDCIPSLLNGQPLSWGNYHRLCFVHVCASTHRLQNKNSAHLQTQREQLVQ